MIYRFLTSLAVVSLILLITACQTEKKPKAYFNAETFIPSYNLIVPENWTTERFTIPIDFAPSIPYAGVEELRFAPDWGNPVSDDYWTYCYLWYLDGKHTFSAATMKENLEAYYTGLVGRNIDRRSIPKEKLFPVKATFEEIEKQDGDLSTFKGSVHMLDYMVQEPITLNCLIHVKKCAGKDNTYVFFEISPKEETNAIWNTLNRIWSEFQCDVK